MDIALAQGQMCYTNVDGIAPDMRGYRGASNIEYDYDDSSSDDDRGSTRRDRRGRGRVGLLSMVKNEVFGELRNEREMSRRDLRRERKNSRRGEKRGKKDLNRAEKDVKDEIWRMIISHHPYVLA